MISAEKQEYNEQYVSNQSVSSRGTDIFSALLSRSKEQIKREKKQDDLGTESVILFVGQKQSGKTSLISRFLDKDENITPSIALEYTFGRRTNPNGTKDISHIWELGFVFC